MGTTFRELRKSATVRIRALRISVPCERLSPRFARLVVGSLIFAALLCPERLQAEPSGGTSLDLTTGVMTAYVFRGITRADGASLQPSASLTHENFTLGALSAELWAHVPLEGEAEDSDVFREVDGTLRLSRPFGPITLSVGHVHYFYPRKGDQLPDTAELLAEVQFQSILNPRVTGYHDYRANDSSTVELSLHDRLEYDWFGGVNVSPFVVAAWTASRDPRFERDGIAHITSGLMSEIPLAQVVLVPNVHYTHAIDGATESGFWGGIVISTSFELARTEVSQTR